MNKAYLVYNPYGLSYMSSLDTVHSLWGIDLVNEVLRCMENGMCAYLTEECAYEIAQKDGKVSDTIRKTLAHYGFL